MRKDGWTHREIVKELGTVSLGTVAVWTEGIILSSEQKVSIEMRRKKRMNATYTRERREILAKHARKFLAPFIYKRRYTNKMLIMKIKDFYRKNGRIPLKREFNSYRGFRLRFGSWNNAIVKAGFTPNPCSARRYIARDGHTCDSLAEKMIDDFLFEHHVKHERSVPYQNYNRFKTDFVINGTFVEYFGRVGLRDYDEIIMRKKALCQQANVRLIELYPTDILEKKKLPDLLSEFTKRKK